MSMRMAFDELADDWKAEGREEGKREGIKTSLLGLFYDDTISMSILLQSAEKAGVLDDVKKELETSPKKKPSTGRKI